MAVLKISIRYEDSKNGNCNSSRCDDCSHNHHARSNIIAVEYIYPFERDAHNYFPSY